MGNKKGAQAAPYFHVDWHSVCPTSMQQARHNLSLSRGHYSCFLFFLFPMENSLLFAVAKGMAGGSFGLYMCYNPSI